MRQLRIFGWSLLCAWGLAGPLSGQDADRIWGRVQTVSGDVHTGFIRWDRNEGSWVDILDGTKEIPDENYRAWLATTRSGEVPVRTIDLLGYRISWDEEDPDFPATAASGIRFGHLASLRVGEGSRAELSLRSGEVVEFRNGSTDLGPSIRELTVDVPGGAEVELEWSDLERIDFSGAPREARATARRLYGTVEDHRGRTFTGYLSWDLDEILESDVLDGEEIDGGDEREIRFRDIASIERIESGARVVLEEGEAVDLTGSNDVDDGHRGVQISDPLLGMVEVEWEEFRIVRFHETDAVVGYDAFDGGRVLYGTVVTESGEEFEGEIRWDADEGASWEFLNGRSDDVVFTIEFGYVSRIERTDPSGSSVTLVDGRVFELDDSNDVDWDNKGILVARYDDGVDAEPDGARWRVIEWDDFREIRFHDAPIVGRGRDGS